MGKTKDAFKLLRKRYKSITLEEIQDVEKLVDLNQYKEQFYGSTVAKKLTGYGSKQTCTLCLSVNKHCIICPWVKLTSKHCYDHSEYYLIGGAKNAEELLEAFQKRAKYMKQFM